MCVRVPVVVVMDPFVEAVVLLACMSLLMEMGRRQLHDGRETWEMMWVLD